MTEKPYAPACDRNREPILEVLRRELTGSERVVEIGSGTGQHAVCFARAMPGLTWQCTDLAGNLPGISAWLAEAALPNTPPPVPLNVSNDTWPSLSCDVLFTSNSLHIMAWHAVESLFEALQRGELKPQVLLIYGPFNYGGEYTSLSNEQFDKCLKANDPASAIRDRADVDALASAAGFVLQADHEMPANNRLLVWRAKSG